MHAAVRVFAAVCLLLGTGLAHGQLVNGRYGSAQVFDVQRSPVFPVAFTPFTVSDFAEPVQGGSPSTYTLAAGEQVGFVEVSSTPCRYSLNLYDSSGTLVRTVHPSGTIYGLGSAGFLHVSDPGDFGTFVANTSGYALGDSLGYIPYTGEATCADTAGYPANTTPINTASPRYTVGGSVSGLTAPGLVLQLNGTSSLPIAADGPFAFPAIADGSTYSVNVASSPTGQGCSVSNPFGTLSGANVTNIAVSCSYTVTFTVSGLQANAFAEVFEGGTSMGLYRNGTYVVDKNDGQTYAITLPADPAGHVCAVSGPAVGAIAGAGVSGVAVTCDPIEYSVGGKVAPADAGPAGIVGLAPGNRVRLRLDYTAAVDPCAAFGALTCKVTADGNEEKDFTQNGDFSFTTQLNVGDSYAVGVASGGNPVAPYPQTCTAGISAVGKLPGVSGTLKAADVDFIKVDCAPLYFAVEGEVIGLAATNSLVLRNNGGDDLEVTGDGTVRFATLLANASNYAVTVQTQPTTPNQTCTLQPPSKGSGPGQGVISGANGYFGRYVCTTTTYTVGGSVSGLAGSGLVLQLNGGANLPVAANGSFTFPALADGSAYDVTVLTQPTSPNQTCTVGAASGTLAGANVSNVSVSCAANSISVGGSASGLATDNTVTIRKSVNGVDDDLVVNGNGPFTFATPVAQGENYLVSVVTNPTTPEQTCTITNGFGTAGTSAVTNVSVFCDTNTYTVGGSVSGLVGSGLVLQLNGASDLPVAGNGSFTFAGLVPSGGTYTVSVATQPSNPAQTCTVGNGSGTLDATAIGNVSVSCSTRSFTVGGTVSGLAGSGLVLQLNGGSNLPVSANGGFVFPAIADGSTYAVTVLTPPSSPRQTCSVSGGNGTLSGANISTVAVTCTTSTFTVGGTVSGLAGSGLVLQLNGGSNLPVSANGSFVFPAIADGSTYAVTVLTPPSSPAQACTVSSGSGTLAGANVTGVSVSCVTSVVPPGAPTAVQVSITGSSATITWAPPASNGGGPITGYTVVTQPGGLSCTVSGNPPPTSCQISGLQPNRQYVFTVTASNTAGAGAGASTTAGTAADAPAVIPIDQPWALALLGALMLLLGGVALPALRRR